MIPEPQGPDPAERPPRAGFSLPVDMVVAPGRGFVKIARTNEWIPAFVVIVISSLLAVALSMPAIEHIRKVQKIAADGNPGELEILIAIQTVLLQISISLVVAIVLTALARARDPQTPFVRFFALAINCLVPAALGSLLHAAVVGVHSPQTYGDLRSYVLALPDSLGVIAAPGNERELDFLGKFDAFDAWSFVLIAFGFSLFAGIRFDWAIVVAILLYFVYAVGFNF